VTMKAVSVFLSVTVLEVGCLDSHVSYVGRLEKIRNLKKKEKKFKKTPTDLLHYPMKLLQLKYYNSYMFRPHVCHSQEVYIDIFIQRAL
jgi:hypothetical protein